MQKLGDDKVIKVIINNKVKEDFITTAIIFNAALMLSHVIVICRLLASPRDGYFHHFLSSDSHDGFKGVHRE